MDRRTFIKGTAAASLAVAGSSFSVALADETPAAATDVPSWLGEEPQIDEAEIAETKETTLLIIGAGCAGLPCAATAIEMGLDFILAEKLPVIPESRTYLGAVNSHLIVEAGIEADKGKLLNELSRYASGKCDRDVIKLWIDESAEMIDWIELLHKGAGQTLMLPDYRSEDAGGTDYYAPVTEHMGSSFYIPPTRNEILLAYIENSGHEVSYGYDMVKLVHDNGQVTGAIFETENGYVQVNAKYTVVATGGYPANSEMLMALQPDTVASVTAAGYHPADTGQGIKAGLWAGAMKENDATPMVFDRGIVEPGVDAGYEVSESGRCSFRAQRSQLDLMSQPFLKVNRRGKRFCNESTPYDNMAFAGGRQPGGVYCMLFDGNASDDIVRFRQTGCAAVMRLFVEAGLGGVDEYLEYVGCGPEMKKADTLEELAEMLGFEGADKDAFFATIEQYNAMYEAGEDTQYGKEAYRLSAIKEPPFYGVWCGGTLLTTLDGLRINARLEALTPEFEPIPGLYAIGDASGSFFNTNYPEYIVGVAAGRTTVEGRHLAKQIAAEEGVDVEAATAAAMEALSAAVTEEPAPADYVMAGAIIAW